MKKILPTFLRGLLFSALFVLISTGSFANHIKGAQMSYRWISGLTYEIDVYLYGDCSSVYPVGVSTSFYTLPVSSPQVCIYQGTSTTAIATLNLVVSDTTVCGKEITPVCPDSLSHTSCVVPSSSIPGIMKFVYTTTYTFPSSQAVWRMVYDGNDGGSATIPATCTANPEHGTRVSIAVAGRSTAITNLGGATTEIQLIDTLNTTTSRGHNSSPELTVEPTPFFCADYENCYNPGATDILDTSSVYHEPSGDSLTFALVAPTQGSTSCGSIGGPCTYRGGMDAWTVPTVQPIGPATPIQCNTGASFTFDNSTGQLCFNPITQTSTLVYNIEEYFHDTLTGTMQREMNFYVEACTYTNPTGVIDSFNGAGDTSGGFTHYTACQYSGNFNLFLNPTEPDTAGLQIIITASGLDAGLTFTAVNNGTSAPQGIITGNTGVLVPGNYTVFLTYTDNHCPLTATTTQAITITVLPVPSLHDTIDVKPTCTAQGYVLIDPGGYGKPWTVKISDSLTGVSDTIFSMTDTTTFGDSLKPNVRYHLTIFTSVSNLCAVDTTLTIPPAEFKIGATFTNPLYCGSATGTIVVDSLLPTSIDSIHYEYNTVWQTAVGNVATLAGTDTLPGLLAGDYEQIYATRGYCVSDTVGPEVLVNPPFTFRSITFTNPSKHCACDGTDTIYGLHPGQLDSITYWFTAPGGSAVPQPLNIQFIEGDSVAYMTGLCEGVYSNFTIRTDSVCSVAFNGPFSITTAKLVPSFTTQTIYGCAIDTVVFTNSSMPASILSYKWDFGDGTTDTVLNPRHPYYDIVGQVYTVTLTVSDRICDSTKTDTIPLNNYIRTGFTFLPDPYVCQGSLVTFADTSNGVGVANNTGLTYTWNFGDGNSTNTVNATHTYANTGSYTIQLIAGNDIPCFDTAYATIAVDSISPISINVTDSVICRGSDATFTGIFTTIGDTLVEWSFGDGYTIYNVNNVLHGFDATGTLTVTLNALYRACPATEATRTIQVYPSPEIYLGADTAMCPGSQPILLSDNQNSANVLAKWLWNTGATTPSIEVVKPGTYYVAVTIDGCSTTDTVFVRNDCYISVPNVFTPNNDGLNDYFFPSQILSSGLVSFNMSIYNRWGQEVFQTTSVNGRGWDGNFNSLPQPEGVYVYIIEATFKDGQTEHHQGNVTLLR